MTTTTMPATPADPPDHTPTPAAARDHIPALDGLRGLAILMVLIWHFCPFSQPWFPGWAGVDLFFVLSGYLITWRLIRSRNQPHYFSHFYRNRALRILPLYYGLVISFLLAIHFFVHKNNQATLNIYFDHWRSFLLFTQNWTFIRFGLPPDLSLVPLWSIAVEEQFYLVWPLLILLLPKSRFGIRTFPFLILLVLLARTAWYLLHPSSGHDIYYNTFFRLDGFLMGSLLYLLNNAGIRLPAKTIMIPALLLLIAGMLVVKSPFPENAFFATAGFTLVAIFFGGLLYLSTQPGDNRLARSFEAKPLRFLGRISYCLYLIHVPILLLISTRMHAFATNRWPGHDQAIYWLAASISLILSLVLSHLSYRYIESWFLKHKTKDPFLSKLKVDKWLTSENPE